MPIINRRSALKLCGSSVLLAMPSMALADHCLTNFYDGNCRHKSTHINAPPSVDALFNHSQTVATCSYGVGFNLDENNLEVIDLWKLALRIELDTFGKTNFFVGGECNAENGHLAVLTEGFEKLQFQAYGDTGPIGSPLNVYFKATGKGGNHHPDTVHCDQNIVIPFHDIAQFRVVPRAVEVAIDESPRT